MTTIRRDGVAVTAGDRASSAPCRRRSDHADGVALARYLVDQHLTFHAELGGLPDLVDLARTMRETWGQVDWRNASAAAGMDGPVSTAMQCVTVAELDRAASAVTDPAAGIARARTALRGTT